MDCRLFVFRFLVVGLALALSSCAISYKFNGASIDYSTTQVISIEDFPNHAALVYPPLSNDLSEAIRDLYARQTRLRLSRNGGDLELSGEIIGYELAAVGVAADNYAAQTKLTLRVQVHFVNNVAPEESFDRVYSASQSFDASQMLTDVQGELCAAMITEISEQIYNDTVARW